MTLNMSRKIREQSGSGQVRLPSFLATCASHKHLLRSLTLAVICLVAGGAVQGQTRQQLRQQRQVTIRRIQAERAQNQGNRAQNLPVAPIHPSMGRRAGLVRPPLDKIALELLHKMIRPDTGYTGEMVTQVAAQGNSPLQQTIKGDKQGRTLVTFLNGMLAGDILVVTPGEVRNYHRSTGVMDVAQWPTEWDDHEKRMFNAIRSGFYTARVVGSEQVAGRQASIVELLPVAGVGEPGRPHFKFWIDQVTGIQLKNEKSDAMGRVLSHRYLTSINVGDSVVTPQDFNLKVLNQAHFNPLFPQDSQYHSLEQAQGHLPFVPVIPTALPNGFKPGEVWVFPGANNQMQFVLLRFTDGVTSFSLYEHMVLSTTKPGRLPSFNHHIERWRVPRDHDEIEATYTGMLTPNQVRAIYESLH